MEAASANPSRPNRLHPEFPDSLYREERISNGTFGGCRMGITQLETLHLAGGGFRQFRHKFHPIWPFVGGKASCHMLLQLARKLEGRGRAVAQYNVGSGFKQLIV